jgi:hypothetical protein
VAGALRNFLADLIILALVSFENWIDRANDLLSDPLGSWDNVLAIATGALMPFAMLIIGICLLIEIAQVLTKVDMVKWEHGIKLGFKMAMSVALLNILPTFLRACYLQAVAWINAVVGLGGIGLGVDFQSDLTELIDGVSGLGTVLGLFVSTIVLVLAIQVCGIIIMAIAFGRMFEIYVYLAVSPIPAAFFPIGDGSGGGFSRITMKFLRSFAAVCLQGVMMMICMRLFSILLSDILTDVILTYVDTGESAGVTQIMFTFLLGSIALVMSVIKSGGWAKSILDAA